MTALPNTSHTDRQPAAPSPDALTDVAIEVALLGGLLLTPDDWTRVSHLTTDHFTDRRHKLLWRAMTRLHERGLVISMETVKSELGFVSPDNDKTKYVREVGEDYLYSLMTQAGPHVDDYRKILMDIEWRRDVNTQIEKITKLNNNRALTSHQVTEEMSEIITGLMMKAAALIAPSGHTLATQAAGFVETYLDDEASLPALDTGYPELTRVTGGFEPGRVYIFAGRPGTGKSVMAQNISLHLMRSRKRGLILSVEMPESEYFMRALSSESQIEASKIKKRTMTEREIERFNEALTRFETQYAGAKTLYTVFMKRPTLAQIRAKAVETHFALRPEGLDFIMFDYMGDRKITPPKHMKGDPAAIMGAISQTLKELAVELNIVVIAVAQASRESERRGGKPSMSDLHGASALEHDADFIGFLYDETPYSEGLGYGETHLHITKSRTGIKEVTLQFESLFPMFTLTPWRR